MAVPPQGVGGERAIRDSLFVQQLGESGSIVGGDEVGVVPGGLSQQFIPHVATDQVEVILILGSQRGQSKRFKRGMHAVSLRP